MTAGRPTKLTPELQESICEALRAGNYIEPSAIMNTVSKASLYSWLRRGAVERSRLAKSTSAKVRAREAPFLEFLYAVERAQAEAEVRDVAQIALAAKSQWQASAWRLERKYPKRWGRRQLLEHTGEGGGPIESKATIVQYPVNGRDKPEEK